MYSVNLNAQTDYYYYYNGEKQYLKLDTKHIFVSFADKNAANVFAQTVKQTFLHTDIPDKIPLLNDSRRFWTELDLEESLSNNSYLAKLSELKNNSKEIIVSPCFKNQFQDKIGLSNFLYVKLNSLNDTIILKQEVEKENAIIVLQNQFMPLWFVVSITEESKHDAMEMANRFYESKLFQYAEPDLIVDDWNNCVNDTHFSKQWGLRNIGQSSGTSGIDIKACNAWQISTGNNITVAILDQGIDLTHPDLAANRHPLSFDCENRTVPQIIRGNHGTACAGIIGAVQNNNSEGITGVAPNCRLMSISNTMEGTPLSRMSRADGINWAWQNGADIISNSWGSSVQYQIIDDAINAAITQGRVRNNVSLGCVVVFASGNDNASTVNYPASLSNVIAVGAVDRCGYRSGRANAVPISCDPWPSNSIDPGSNFGTALDVVAPGTNIPTTDLQGSTGYNTANGANGNYYMNFSGTSAACPHVAGIAALILSVRPDLTQAQVRQAIESTCTKINPTIYSYAANANHPNGTWYNQVGHGLVNAYDAVYSVVPRISGPTVICTGTTATYTILNLPAGASVAWDKSSELTLTSGTTGSSLSVTSRPMIFGKEEWVQAVITIPGMPANTIRLGGIRLNGYIPIVGPDEIYYDTPKEYYYAEEGAISYSWTSTTMQILSGANTHICKVKPLSLPGDGMLTCEVVTWCGTYYINKDIHIIDYSGWIVYPNPSSSVIHLVQEQSQNSMSAVQQTNNARKTASTIVVQLASALSGTIVRSQTVSDFSNNLDMDISNVPNGTYVIAVSKENKIVHRQTIIIQH